MTSGWSGLRKELVKGKQINIMKGVAIPYVIALVLGVVIIGLTGFWFITQSGKTVGVGETAQCSSLKFNFCNGFVSEWDSTCGTFPNCAEFGKCETPGSSNLCTNDCGGWTNLGRLDCPDLNPKCCRPP